MTATVIDGSAIAASVREKVFRDVAMLSTAPVLATVLVGDDPASAIYVRKKRQQCVEAGIGDLHKHLPHDITQENAVAVIDELAAAPDVTGILLQLPLPTHLNAAALIDLIPPEKDVDGLTESNAGRLALGRPGLRPCTPAGVLVLLDRLKLELAGAHAVVIGRSALVGKPMAQLLLQHDATVTTCHSHTRHLAAVCARADVLVVAAGIPRLIGKEAIKPGATVIDVGMHRSSGGVCGDVDADTVREVAGALTPVPGGVGPMTIAMLLRNTADAARAASTADVGK